MVYTDRSRSRTAPSRASRRPRRRRRVSTAERQHGVLVVVVLLLEELPARHRDDADVRLERLRPPRARGAPRCPSRSRSPRARPRRAATACRRRAGRRSPARPRCGRSVGSFCRVSASATGPSGRSSAIRHAIEVSLASAGRTYQRFGIARSAMWCSTGWCVGPSSPTAIESCVQTHAVSQAHRAPRGERPGACSPRRSGTWSRRGGASPARARSRSRSSPSRARGSRRRCCGRRACAEKTPAPSNSVLFDSTRSAEPPTIVGVNGFSACITVRPASRVATSSPAGKTGSASRQPSRGSPRRSSSRSPRELRERAAPRRRAVPPTRAAARRRARRRPPCARAPRPRRRTSRRDRSP